MHELHHVEGGDVLGGAAGPVRDVVLLNAAAALLAAGVAGSPEDGVARGAEALDSGRALAVVDGWAGITGGAA